MARRFELSDQLNFKPHRLMSRKITKLLTFFFTSSFPAAAAAEAADNLEEKTLVRWLGRGRRTYPQVRA